MKFLLSVVFIHFTNLYGSCPLSQLLCSYRREIVLPVAYHGNSVMATQTWFEWSPKGTSLFLNLSVILECESCILYIKKNYMSIIITSQKMIRASKLFNGYFPYWHHVLKEFICPRHSLCNYFLSSIYQTNKCQSEVIELINC